jgi:hypothetical protein
MLSGKLYKRGTMDSRPNLYGAIATLQSGLRANTWSVAQMYLVFQTVALPLVFSPDTNIITKFIISLGGFGVSILLPMVIFRWIRRVLFLSGKLTEIEQSCNDRFENGFNVKVFSSMEYRSMSRKLSLLHVISAFGAIIMILLWTQQAIRHGYIAFPEIFPGISSLIPR